MNTKIEDGQALNWQAFNKIKRLKSTKDQFDSSDMNNFENFFSKLYDNNHKSMTDTTKTELINTADEINQTSNCDNSLNCPITREELSSTVKLLKSGKASSSDMISNEILKSLDSEHMSCLLKLYNSCLTQGKYPWNISIITPLHKKGNKSDPDNYRAVAVSSVIGKLFSTILLDRMIRYRKINHPDPPNQLGFTKKAQTLDHIFTLNTITEKYKKLKKPVYAIFVDFKKAFDSVCRQALFYKLSRMGLTGNFYNVLRNMYSNSYAYIKLSGHISKRIQIKKGTEQGHPLSPDLFKIFLSDLSPLLDLESENCPKLLDKLISHLLWADDMILLSLDRKTAQNQLNVLERFCNEWGIEVNEIKTQAVIFNEKFSDNTSTPQFKINDKILKNVTSYCYLGIHLSSNGSMSLAQNNLKLSAVRAFLGLKRTVMRSKLSFKAISNLFNSLIKPILLYGAPIWTPINPILKNITKDFSNNTTQNQLGTKLFQKISRTPQEQVHLSFLKWALGVHRKSSNVGCWGETGRYPLIYEAMQTSLKYFNRLKHLDKNTLAYLALCEQIKLNLKWYKNMTQLLDIDELFKSNHVIAYKEITKKEIEIKYQPMSTHQRHLTATNATPLRYQISKNELKKSQQHLKAALPIPSRKFRTKHIIDLLKNKFETNWQISKSSSSKLSFYNSFKSKFNQEPYLNISKGFSRRYSTTQLRISAHDLEIENGRYKQLPQHERICTWCKTSMDLNTIEDENHLLYTCDLYSRDRRKLISRLNRSPPNNIDTPTSTNHSTTLIQHQLMTLLGDPTSTDYTVNCICTYILKCFETRKKFQTDRRIRTDTLQTQHRNHVTHNAHEINHIIPVMNSESDTEFES